MNPKLLAVLIVVMVIVFVIVMVIGARKDDNGLNIDLVESFGSALADTFLSGSAIDLREVKIAPGNDTACLNKVSRLAKMSQGDECEYTIAPSQAAVRNLTFKLNAGRCLRVVLDNADEDALRAELIIVNEEVAASPDTDEDCDEPNEPTLAIFEKAGDLLTLSCLDGGEEGGCIIELNPDAEGS